MIDKRYYCIFCERWMTITGVPDTLCDKIEQLALKAVGLAHGLCCQECKKKMDLPAYQPSTTVTLRRGGEYVVNR